MPPAKRTREKSSLYTQKQISTGKGYVEKPAVDWFIRFVSWASKRFRFGKGAKFTPEQKELFEFLNYKITSEEFRNAEYAALFIGLAISVLIILLLWLAIAAANGSGGSSLQNPIFLVGSLLSLIIPFGFFLLVAYQPQAAAKREQTNALGYVSEIINYLVSSLRLNPNLEKAVEFAAIHGRGKIAEDLKKIIWEVQVGTYLSVEEAIDDLAYRWGKYNDDFKQALMLIRSSSLEANDAKRELLLEKAVTDVLEGSKEKMEAYARALSQPTVYLYYFGVLLPLMLAIVLPIGGTLVGESFIFAKPEILALIYVILLPAGLFLLGSNILGSRPPTYTPPEITEDYPGLPAKGYMRLGGVDLPVLPIALIVLIAIIFAGVQLDRITTVEPLLGFERLEVLASKPHIALLTTPDIYFGLLSILGVIVGTGCGIGIYLYGTYAGRKKVQDEIRSMEREFKDAIYVLASRLGENRPIEEALKHAVEFLPNSILAKRVFKKILDNITTLGMTIDDAVFDKNYGALKNIPSKTIESGLRITIDSIELGVNVAAKSIIGLALQLRNAEKIDLLLRNLLSSVTTMLKTMGTFIAPIVLGVVTSLQAVIVNALSSAATTSSTEAPGVSGFGGASTSGLGSIFKKTVSTDPATFTLIMGIYVIEVVVLLTYFNSQVEDSNNKLHTYIEIAKALPVATILFAIVAYFAGTTIGG